MKRLIVPFLIFSLTLYGLFLAHEYFSRVPEKKTVTRTLSRGDESALMEWMRISQFPPSSAFQYTGFEGEKIVFDVLYHFNERALRIEEQTGKKKNHLILGGCSLVFGVALNANETLSSVLRSHLPQTNVLNFGFPGGGLQTLMKANELIDLRTYVSQDAGYFLYGFDYDHFSRWKAVPQYLGWINPEHVHYQFDENGFRDTRIKFTDEWKKFELARSAGVLQAYLKANVFVNYPEEDLRTFLLGIKHLRGQYLRKFPKGKFKIVIYPFAHLNLSVELLKKMLKKEGIGYYDSTSDFEEFLRRKNLKRADMLVPVDGHPNIIPMFNTF